MQEPYRKGSSESILTSSLAGDIARCLLKRRQRHRWAGPLSCEKPVDQDADFIPSRRKAKRQPRKSRVDCRFCVVCQALTRSWFSRKIYLHLTGCDRLLRKYLKKRMKCGMYPVTWGSS